MLAAACDGPQSHGNTVGGSQCRNQLNRADRVLEVRVVLFFIVRLQVNEAAECSACVLQSGSVSVVFTAFGFSFDATQVAKEITACTNVVNKYHKALVCGALDPETTLPQFNSELKDAGIDAIIEEKQAQLDAWLAEQK